MIRHVVSWKLKDDDAAAKATAASEITEALLTLPKLISEVRSFTVATNMAYPEKNFDVILMADFESLEDLEAYQVHPEHLKVGSVVQARVSARACVDFEV